MLYLQFNVSMFIQQCLREIDEARQAIDPYARLPDEYTGELRRHALAEAVHYSTQIEGNVLTLAQVQDLLTGENVRAPRDQVREVENYREAMAYIQSLVPDESPRVTEDTIRSVHYLITKSLAGAYVPGRYRTQQNYVVDRRTNRRIFLPPSDEHVQGLMKEFVDWLNSKQDYPPPIKAALTHLNLVAIHPFLDGNGRTARVVDALVLYQGGFKDQDLVSLEAYFGRDNRGYYEALSSALGPHYSPPRDVTSWVEYHLLGHVRQAQDAVRIGGETATGLDGLWAAFGAEGLSPRHIVALWLACTKGRVSNRAYRSITGRSTQSVVTDFNKLMDVGLLLRVGRGRSAVYVPSERVRDVFDSILRSGDV